MTMQSSWITNGLAVILTLHSREVRSGEGFISAIAYACSRLQPDAAGRVRAAFPVRGGAPRSPPEATAGARAACHTLGER